VLGFAAGVAAGAAGAAGLAASLDEVDSVFGALAAGLAPDDSDFFAPPEDE
jgi:hypothetical protein